MTADQLYFLETIIVLAAYIAGLCAIGALCAWGGDRIMARVSVRSNTGMAILLRNRPLVPPPPRNVKGATWSAKFWEPWRKI